MSILSDHIWSLWVEGNPLQVKDETLQKLVNRGMLQKLTGLPNPDPGLFSNYALSESSLPEVLKIVWGTLNVIQRRVIMICDPGKILPLQSRSRQSYEHLKHLLTIEDKTYRLNEKGIVLWRYAVEQ